jgi:hypothetical protein
MKVQISLTVAVDPDDWAETYGIRNDPATIRDDVKRWAVNAIVHHPDGLLELAAER